MQYANSTLKCNLTMKALLAPRSSHTFFNPTAQKAISFKPNKFQPTAEARVGRDDGGVRISDFYGGLIFCRLKIFRVAALPRTPATHVLDKYLGGRKLGIILSLPIRSNFLFVLCFFQPQLPARIE